MHEAVDEQGRLRSCREPVQVTTAPTPIRSHLSALRAFPDGSLSASRDTRLTAVRSRQRGAARATSRCGARYVRCGRSPLVHEISPTREEAAGYRVGRV